MESLTSKMHKCGECSKSLCSSRSLKTHMLVHCDDRPHICSVCQQGFKTKNVLDDHMTRHSDERLFLCNICGITFKTARSLRRHGQTHTGKLYPCSQCEKVYKQKKTLVQHIRESHEVAGSSECNECGKCFRGKLSFNLHLKRHLKELCSYAKICENQEKSETEIKYECKICEKRFSSISNLRAHIDSHPEVITFSCDKCKEIFLSKDIFSDHVKAHSSERSMECTVCGETFTSEHYLRVHKQEHKRKNGYRCEECQKCFSCNSKLLKHMRIHKGEKPFKCDECGKRFTEKGHLKVHTRVHTGEKPYWCDLCNTRFVTGSSLKRHMLTHSSVKHYKCNMSIHREMGESSDVRIATPETVQVFINEEASDCDGERVEEDRNPLEVEFIKCELSRDEVGDTNESTMESDDTNDLLEGNNIDCVKEREIFSPKENE